MSEIEPSEKNSIAARHDGKHLVKVVSFGFKKNNLPNANLMLDVRFLKNPYWVEELRPLTGRDPRVRNYVMEQDQAKDILAHLLRLLEQFVPALLMTKTNSVTIAIGCTGGQHRSVAVVEALSDILKIDYPDYQVTVEHRELEAEKSAISAKESSALRAHSADGSEPAANGHSERRTSTDRRTNSDRRAGSENGTTGGARQEDASEKLIDAVESGVKQ